jgi:hypothetical protein
MIYFGHGRKTPTTNGNHERRKESDTDSLTARASQARKLDKCIDKTTAKKIPADGERVSWRRSIIP